MKRLTIFLLQLAIASTLSAQNTTAEQEALYYIKKAYQHQSDADKATALKYLKVFEDYLSAHLKPEDVGDSISIYYARTVAKIAISIDRIAAGGSSINMQKAYDFSIRPAEKGNRECQAIIGYFGWQKEDFYVEFIFYCLASVLGSDIAQNNFGWMYDNGYGVSKDYSEAVEWYRKAAEQGNARGQTRLGLMYIYGYGVLKDYAEAIKWFRKAVEQGYSGGANALGWMYENGCGVSQDYSEAVKLYRKSAEQGNDMGQSNLGAMYHNGTGVQRNSSEAIKWYRKAAQQGNETAQNNLRKLGETW